MENGRLSGETSGFVKLLLELSTAAWSRHFSKGHESTLPALDQRLLDDGLRRPQPATPFVLDARRGPASLLARFNQKTNKGSI
jgi:hypothetical protein